MAALVRHVAVGALSKSVFSPVRLHLGAAHTLFTNAAIGVDGYENVRDKVAQQFKDLSEKFRTRMKQCLASETELIFTEDLKNMLHLVQNNPDDLELCTQMIHKFNTQNKELRFGTYTFGPVIMRTLHYLNQPDLALKIAEDKDLRNLFDQITSYVILMDLMYKHGQYDNVLKLFQVVQERQLYGTRFPRDCLILVLAACYKLNTPESFKHAVGVVRSARENGAVIVRKACIFCAALAIKQNSPQTAMEILSLTQNTNYVTVRALRLMALSDMDRVEDALRGLEQMLETDVPDFQKLPTIFKEVLDNVQKATKRSGNKELMHKYQNLERGLKERKMISEESLDSLICTPVLPRVRSDQNQQNRFNVPGNRSSVSSQHGYEPEARTFRVPHRSRRGISDFDE